MISAKEVAELLSMKDCIDVMEKTFISMSQGFSKFPQRQALRLPDNSGLMGLMPALDTDLGKLSIKAITVFPYNHKSGKASHQGIVALFDDKYGELLSIIDAGEITSIRTAAVSAIGTRLLANKNASDLFIIGCGVQAIKHVEAILLIRPIKKIRAWDLNPDAAESFAAEAYNNFEIRVEIQYGKKAVVEGADIICTLTPSIEPVLFGKDVTSGMHINAVGACSSNARELDTEVILKSKIFVDKKEAALNEAGDILIPMKECSIDKNHELIEIEELYNEGIDGRISSKDITLFKSLGLAIEDLYTANFIYNSALKKQMGTLVAL